MSEKKKFTYEQGGSMRPRQDAQGDERPQQARPAADPGRADRQHGAANAQTARQNGKGTPPVQQLPKKAATPQKDKKRAPRKKRKGLIVALSVLGALIVAVTALQLTGVFSVVGMVAGLFGGSPSLYTYSVSSQEYLVRYLQHPALKPGDTLELEGNFEIDVDADFGGFAMLPLLNFGGSGSVAFKGGTVVMSGAESGIDMSRASFSGTELYIDAPKVSLTLGSADDTNINVASLNGAVHTRDLQMPFAGTRMSIPVTFTNESGETLSNVQVSLTSGGFIFYSDTVTIDSLAAGGSVTVDVDVVAVEGGRQEIRGYAVDSAGNQTVSGTSGYVNILGAGYYAGDLHTHTEASRSQRFGTLTENVTYGYEHGMSYIVSVENNEEAEKLSQTEVDSLVGSTGAFLQLVGGETGEELLHLLILNSELRPRDDYGTEIMDHGIWIYQDAINEVVRDGGLAILPHFFSYGALDSMIPLLKSSRNATAMELFTLDMRTYYTELSYYTSTWSAVNVQGRQKLFGLFSSNNVYSSEVGTKYIKGYMPTLRESNIYDMLQTGNYIMSNGPDLRFTMGHTQMGGDLYTTEEGGAVNVNLYASDASPLTTLRLLKYNISGNIDDIEYEVVYEQDFTGQGVYSFNDTFDLEIAPNTFYRVELASESARDYEDTGIALSNPIFVYKGESNSFYHIDKLSTAMGSAVKQAPNGTYYIETANLKTGAVNVMGSGESYTIDYHINGGDHVADFITVTMLGGNGTLTSLRVYVLN